MILDQTALDQTMAARFAASTLGHVGREYPNVEFRTLLGPEDLATPSTLHPIFYGSYDWHSCVHGWWQLLRLARLFPAMPEAAQIRARTDALFVADKVAGERAFLDRPGTAGFERPYGWAWLLALHDEAARHDADWAEALAPLAEAFAARFRAHLPKLTYAIRVGTHFNSSFALVLARDWAATRDPALMALIDACAHTWFAGDRGCQAWEPGGDEFLSPALTEALLMSRVLPSVEFVAWFDGFLPGTLHGDPATLFTPATVSDRSDGKIAHLDGLNLSRAWCWRSLAAAHPAIAPVAEAAAAAHLAAALPHLADDYMGEHWLASFALLALAPEP